MRFSLNSYLDILFPIRLGKLAITLTIRIIITSIKSGFLWGTFGILRPTIIFSKSDSKQDFNLFQIICLTTVKILLINHLTDINFYLGLNYNSFLLIIKINTIVDNMFRLSEFLRYERRENHSVNKERIRPAIQKTHESKESELKDYIKYLWLGFMKGERVMVLQALVHKKKKVG